MVYLADHPPLRRQFISPRRSRLTGAIVLHDTESSTDEDGIDTGAEAVARFISNRTTAGSYHTITDSDSALRLIEYGDEAFGEGTGGNRWALHLALAYSSRKMPTDVWWSKAIPIAARAARLMADHVRRETGIVVPARRITAAEYRDGAPGFIAHGDIDPGRRSDPVGFPWNVFLTMYRHLGDGMAFECTHPKGCPGEIQQVLKDLAIKTGLPQIDPGDVDGDIGPKTTLAVHSVKNILLQQMGLQ